MNEQEPDPANQEPKPQNVEIDDLPVSQSEQEEIKGGSGSTVWNGVVRL